MKTRGITEGAMFCALGVILTLVCNYIPFINNPGIFYTGTHGGTGKRQGLKVSILFQSGGNHSDWPVSGPDHCHFFWRPDALGRVQSGICL